MTKSPKKSKGGKIFAIICIGISFALCVTVADLFSSVITAGNFSGLFATSGKISGYKLYAISMFESTIEASAKESADSLKAQNGAGYLWLDDGSYHVLVSAYEKQNDAELVRQNLENSGHSPSILEIPLPEISITSNFSAQEKNAISGALEIFKTTYKSLYDISVSLDTSVKDETECKLALADIENVVNKIKTNFESAFGSKFTNGLLQIKLKIQEVTSLVKELSEYTSTTKVPFSSKIKYNYIEIINLNKKLCKELNNSI